MGPGPEPGRLGWGLGYKTAGGRSACSFLPASFPISLPSKFPTEVNSTYSLPCVPEPVSLHTPLMHSASEWPILRNLGPGLQGPFSTLTVSADPREMVHVTSRDLPFVSLDQWFSNLSHWQVSGPHSELLIHKGFAFLTRSHFCCGWCRETTQDSPVHTQMSWPLPSKSS